MSAMIAWTSASSQGLQGKHERACRETCREVGRETQGEIWRRAATSRAADVGIPQGSQEGEDRKFSKFRVCVVSLLEDERFWQGKSSRICQGGAGNHASRIRRRGLATCCATRSTLNEHSYILSLPGCANPGWECLGLFTLYKFAPTRSPLPRCSSILLVVKQMRACEAEHVHKEP